MNELLKEKFDYQCWERNDQVFREASSKNQNRLHQGFHYPRNSETRLQSREGFSKFMTQYSFLTKRLENNLYLVPRKSFIDFQTYKAIFEYEKYSFSECNSFEEFDNIEGSIATDERMILHNSAQDFWGSANLKINFGESVSLIDSKLYTTSGLCVSEHNDLIIDCTYGELESNDSYFSEYFITFVVQINGFPYDAVTLMDGPFFSLFPYENSNGKFHTLTHVKYGVLKNPKIELSEINQLYKHVVNDCFYYLKDVMNGIELVDYFISRKKKPFSNSDSRAVGVVKKGNVVSVMSGKIDAIYTAEAIIADILRSDNF